MASVAFALEARDKPDELPATRVGLIKGHRGSFITGLTGLFIACIPGACRSDGRRQRGRHNMAMVDVITGRTSSGRTHAQRGRERPSGVRRQGTCRAWEGGRSRPRCVVAPVADDRRGLVRHKPPPVGVRCKSGCDRGLQTPVPRWPWHMSGTRPQNIALAKGEHSAERAFPPAFPLPNPHEVLARAKKD